MRIIDNLDDGSRSATVSVSIDRKELRRVAEREWNESDEVRAMFASVDDYYDRKVNEALAFVKVIE